MLKIKKIVQISFAISFAVMVLLVIASVIRKNNFWDFEVFYSSAKLTLQGENIYRTYGRGNLPYWYFPWIAWLFIPLSFLPISIAKIVYTIITLLSAWYIVYALEKQFSQKCSLESCIFIIASSLLVCGLIFLSGQSDFILAAVTVFTILGINQGQSIKSGIFFPILLFKPHLLSLFIPFALMKGGKKFLLSASVSTLLFAAFAFVVIPNWPSEMLRMISAYGGRTDNGTADFITMAEFIGLNENWSGTANLPITILLPIFSFFVVWKNRRLDTVSLLSLSLAASMFAAPRAYSYNLPFVIPALLWISPGNFWKKVAFWLILVHISLLSVFSTPSYLIVILAFTLSAWKAWQIQNQEISLNRTFVNGGINTD